jgi:hypothetical protein
MAAFLRTDTSDQQHELEIKVSEMYQDLHEFDAADREEMLMLLRDKHTRYLQVCAHVSTQVDSVGAPGYSRHHAQHFGSRWVV